MNLAVRDIRYNRGRFIQTCIGLGLLIAVVMSMGGIYRGLVADATVALRATGADLWVVQQNTDGPFAASSRIPEDVKYRIAAVPGIEKASCLSYQNLQIDRFGKPLRFFLVGYEPGGLGGPPVIVTGRDLRQKHYEVVTDKSMGFAPGDTIPLGQHDYTVVGITEKMASVTGDPYAYVTLADAQDIQFKDSNDAILVAIIGPSGSGKTTLLTTIGLVNEPTAALDTENGKTVMALLKKLALENHSAILVVTHDRRMVEDFDRIFEVHDGKVVRERDNAH